MKALRSVCKRSAVVWGLVLGFECAGLASGFGSAGEQSAAFLQLSSMADPQGFAMLAMGLVAVLVVRKKAI
ncbi:MAG: hypothetical protein SFV51_29975 [Bryobacteraceae bacterium]|nr:hypothetical protein [Bryobacteraceae bacterium]